MNESEVEDEMNASLDIVIEQMRQELFRIGGKVDALPQVYVTKSEHEIWRVGTDRRLDLIEAEQRASRQWNNDEHVRLAETVVESERRIIQQNSGMETRLVEKIDANFKLGVRREEDKGTAKVQHKMSKLAIVVTIVLGSVGWLIGIVEFVIQSQH